MKKYIIICSSILLLYIIFYYVNHSTSLFVSIFKKDITTNTIVKNNDIFVNDKEFIIKGVNLGFFTPSHKGKSQEISKEKYLEWFKLIQEMNANTIRINTIAMPEFYEAFYEYNEQNNKPLYLIQEVRINEYFQKSTRDAYSKDVKTKLLNDIKIAIDVINGKRTIPFNSEYGYGRYNKDVSKWTIAYIIGGNFDKDLIAYTNHKYSNPNGYKGKYFISTEEATAFEIILTEIVDKSTEYESLRYGKQRLISIEINAEIDPLDYDPVILDYFDKYVKLDLNNIKPTSELKSGFFVSFIAYYGYPDYYGILSKTTKTYETYLKNIKEHHKDLPVIISSFGFSTARIVGSSDSPDANRERGLTEEEQASKLIDSINAFLNLDYNGMLIDEWADSWDRTAWNTLHAVDLPNNQFWHDVQTFSTSLGLLKYVDTKANIVLDGETKDWENIKPLISNENHKLSITQDSQNIYVLVEGQNEIKQNIYIPIDITQKSGSKKATGYDINFNRNADYLLIISDQKNSKLLVQERYDTTRAIYQRKIDFDDPYYKKPDINTENFNVIRLVSKTLDIIYENNAYKILNQAITINTGNFKFGSTDPNNVDYNSNADYYRKENIIEIKIPYALLNFSAPSSQYIHNDYYEKYGVENLITKKIYLGVGTNKEIKLEPFVLDNWSKINYKEVLKPAYYSVKEIWGDK